MKMEQAKCSETSTCKIQTPGNYPEETIQHSEHGESLKSRKLHTYFVRIAVSKTTNTKLVTRYVFEVTSNNLNTHIIYTEAVKPTQIVT